MEYKIIPEGALTPDPAFCDTRLNEVDGLYALANDASVLDSANKFGQCKTTSYEDLCNVLNSISRAIHRKFMKGKHEVIIFMDTHARHFRNHPNDYLDGRPDLIAVLESVYKALDASKSPPSWHHILSLVEEKTEVDMSAGPAQCGTYLGLANQGRPDMVAMFGLAACSASYCIQYSSPCGLETSDDFGWSDLEPLLSYVYTLYSPRTDQPSYDRTITLSSNLSVTDAPTWDIEVDGVPYRNCTVKMVGNPWHRMTWTAMTPAPKTVVIKDLYRDEDMTFSEGELYDILQDLGPAPGFPDIVTWYDVKWTPDLPIEKKKLRGKRKATKKDMERTLTITGNYTRTKTRLVMATSGDPLAQCPSLVTFLKVMYDVLEAHRWAVCEKGILHRDISIANILINPRSARKVKSYRGTVLPKFVTEVLHKDRKLAASLALLIDLDNATQYPRKKPCPLTPSRVHHERTGTPRYIARSVAVPEVLIKNCTFEPMPKLIGTAEQLYSDAYPIAAHPLRHFNDQGTSIHCAVYDAEKTRVAYKQDPQLASTNFDHHPRHDAESVFWCIAAFLLRALPGDSTPADDANNKKYNRLWKGFASHEISEDVLTDPRAGVFTTTAKWADILHAGLVRAAPLIAELAEQVEPEYALLSPPDDLHLHEAMQRILFKYIHQWESEGFDVRFNLSDTRNTIIMEEKPRPAVSHHTLDGQNPKKRGVGTLEKPEASESKRRRAKAA